MAGASRALAHLAVSIVLQSIEPEADIADIAAWVEIRKWSDSGWLPIVILQRRQPGVPAAAITPVSELHTHCMPGMPSLSGTTFCCEHACMAASSLQQTYWHTTESPSAAASALASSSRTAGAA